MFQVVMMPPFIAPKTEVKVPRFMCTCKRLLRNHSTKSTIIILRFLTGGDCCPWRDNQDSLRCSTHLWKFKMVSSLNPNVSTICYCWYFFPQGSTTSAQCQHNLYCWYIFPQGRWQESTRAQTPPWSRWKFQRWVQKTKAEKLKHLTLFFSDKPSRGQPQSVSHVELSLTWNSPVQWSIASLVHISHTWNVVALCDCFRSTW